MLNYTSKDHENLKIIPKKLYANMLQSALPDISQSKNIVPSQDEVELSDEKKSTQNEPYQFMYFSPNPKDYIWMPDDDKLDDKTKKRIIDTFNKIDIDAITEMAKNLDFTTKRNGDNEIQVLNKDGSPL